MSVDRSSVALRSRMRSKPGTGRGAANVGTFGRPCGMARRGALCSLCPGAERHLNSDAFRPILRLYLGVSHTARHVSPVARAGEPSCR